MIICEDISTYFQAVSSVWLLPLTPAQSFPLYPLPHVTAVHTVSLETI